MFKARVLSESGYGLPATILLIIVFTLLGAVGLALARQEKQTQVRTTSREAAFYAAETGLARGLEKWSRPDGLYPPGTKWLLDEGTLNGGSSYRVEATMLDDRSIHVLYDVRAEGKTRDGTTQEVGLLVATGWLENPYRAALHVADTASLRGTADVTGLDYVPPSWNGPHCSATDDDVPGVISADTSLFELKGSATADGAPGVTEDADTTGMFSFGDISFEELAAMADINIPAGMIVGDDEAIGPTYNVDGSCDTSDPLNWGDPKNVGQPCSNWFPIIYAEGNMNLEGNYDGQGLLLVNGDLEAKGGFEFFGPVMVRGKLKGAGNFKFHGGVRAHRADLAVGTSQIYYSNCVLQRTLSHTAASRPRPLVNRPWYHNR